MNFPFWIYICVYDYISHAKEMSFDTIIVRWFLLRLSDFKNLIPKVFALCETDNEKDNFGETKLFWQCWFYLGFLPRIVCISFSFVQKNFWVKFTFRLFQTREGKKCVWNLPHQVDVERWELQLLVRLHRMSHQFVDSRYHTGK